MIFTLEAPADCLFCGGIAENSYVRFGAGSAKSLMAMKSFVRVATAFAQLFYLLHLAIIFPVLEKNSSTRALNISSAWEALVKAPLPTPLA